MLISETREPSMVYFHLLLLCKCKKFDGATELLDLLDRATCYLPSLTSPFFLHDLALLVAIIVHDSISGRHS